MIVTDEAGMNAEEIYRECLELYGGKLNEGAVYAYCLERRYDYGTFSEVRNLLPSLSGNRPSEHGFDFAPAENSLVVRSSP
jgi:hypothetical protein